MKMTVVRSHVKRLVLPFLIGAVIGGLGAHAYFTFVDTGGGLEPSREIASFIALLYIVVGGFVLVGSAKPSVGARILNVEDVDEIREQRQVLLTSGLCALMLGALLLTLAFAAPAGPIPSSISGAIAIAILVGLLLPGVASYKGLDEMDLAISREATETAYYLLFWLGGVWVVLAHTGFIGAPAPLDFMSMLLGALLAASIWRLAKRGLLLPRTDTE